jgi:penicillin G amidase
VGKRRSRGWAVVNLALAALVLSGLLYVGARGAGAIPPLGAALNPGTGVWTLGADAQTPANRTLQLLGLTQPVRVTFEPNGTAHIAAATDSDLFIAMGYLHGTFRLFQMDLLRREGEGKLAEVIGKAALPSDEFELQLGLVRTAQEEWDQMAPGDPTRAAGEAYAIGVNAAIDEQVRSGHLPIMFKMLGYTPARWTPLDSLVIQGIMTQTLDFSTGPLHYALLVKALGYDRAMQWFPILPPNEQHPYDPGPYQNDGVAALETSAAQAPAPPATAAVSDGEARSATDLLARFDALPSWAVHQGSNSNNWAVDGAKTATGKPLMAGDPHLAQTLPAIWYQLQADSPTYHVAGVSIPGTPVVLIGHNRHISWSLTNTQNAATLYYAEQTDAAHPHQYFWNGAWRQMQAVHYAIPVKGGATEDFTVNLTVHGPILTLDGQTMSVWWAGAQPSHDLDAMLQIAQASTWAQFREALRGWHAPSQNFVYADDQDNIGLISAGYFPQVASGQPWLPLPGDGSADVTGAIPFDDIPQVYDPPSHIVFSANQREVGPDYPFYIGTTLEFFDPGYRANQIEQTLAAGSGLTAADMEKLQNDTHDELAARIVPKLVEALNGQPLDARGIQAAQLLLSWDFDMRADSPAAAIWMRVWMRYIYDTFHPWWDADKVPVDKDGTLGLKPDTLSGASETLGMSLEAWTLDDPANAGFTLPNGTPRTAPDVMRQAFTEAVSALADQLGPDPTTWTWSRIHTREFRNLAQIPGLGYGPRASGGDNWTVDAADGNVAHSTAGPSWRFVMDWGSGQGWGVYPGGQSENPLSPWYTNQIDSWWDGAYYPMLDGDMAASASGAHTWSALP